MRKSVIGMFVGCLIITAGSVAAEPDTQPSEKNLLTLSGSIDFVTDYYFRGYRQENRGLIAQPSLSLSAEVYSTDDLTIEPSITTWNSLHSKHTGADHSPRIWYETDLSLAVSFEAGPWSIEPIYYFYISPNGAFDTIQEFGVTLSYNDTDLMKKLDCPITFSPYVAWYVETRDELGTNDQYVECGIVPSIEIGETKLTASMPLAVGLSLDGTYQDSDGRNKTFGFYSIGATLTYPLPLPESMGTWNIVGGVTWIRLLADSAKDSNDGDANDFVGRIGLSFEL